ncbi:MAG: hypothetical protein HYY31_06845 [Chloroflexi bacterium]|nr:hypothetical protein [Chloroflexota bacterium]
MPVRLHRFILLAAGGCGAATSYVFSLGIPWDSRDAALAGMLIVIVTLAIHFPLKTAPKTQIAVDTAPTFLALLLLPLPLSLLSLWAGMLLSFLWAKRVRWQEVTFNLAQLGLSMSLGGLAYRALAPRTLDSGGWEQATGVLAAAVAYYAINYLLLTGVVSIHTGSRPLVVLRRNLVTSLPTEIPLLALGYLGALVTERYLWALPLFIPPILAVYLSFRRSVEETRRNVELSQRLEANLEELKRTQAELVQSAKMASLGTMAAGIAHEIRNPLFSISGRAELLLMKPDTHLKTLQAKEFLGVILEMTARVRRITDDLLAFSRPSNTEQVQLNQMVESALRLVEHSIKAQGISIESTLEEQLPPVQANPSQLQQTLVNLLLNAKDATPAGGIIRVRTYREGDAVAAAIEDTGCGIPEENMKRLFEPFFTTKEPGKGTGLGLYLSDRFIREHKGTISVQSQVGKGSIFTVRLPVPTDDNDRQA